MVMSLLPRAWLRSYGGAMVRYQSTGVMLDPGPRDAVKPISEMPSPPSWPLLGHLPLIMKHQLHMDQMFQSLREE